MSDAGGAFLGGGLPRGRTSAASAVLVLHGGSEVSRQRTARRQLAILRMLDMYAGLRRSSAGAAIYLLRYRVRGWNSSSGSGSGSGFAGAFEPDPVVDTRWALSQIDERHPGVPVALLGHSMGGRTAFAVAADRRVVGVCALAPWLPNSEPLVRFRDDQRFVLAHGTADRTTSPALSLDYAQRLKGAGARVARFELEGGRHALLERAGRWHRFAIEVSLGLAGDREMPGGVVAALDDHSGSSLRLPLWSF